MASKVGALLDMFPSLLVTGEMPEYWKIVDVIILCKMVSRDRADNCMPVILAA